MAVNVICPRCRFGKHFECKKGDCTCKCPKTQEEAKEILQKRIVSSLFHNTVWDKTLDQIAEIIIQEIGVDKLSDELVNSLFIKHNINPRSEHMRVTLCLKLSERLGVDMPFEIRHWKVDG
ncbi:MAG: hypothetical protein MRY49_02125 [Candidatus Pacebacteria bacterium]|nr:hypothetical protein [Candidatus Paceibacterota bacterium]